MIFFFNTQIDLAPEPKAVELIDGKTHCLTLDLRGGIEGKYSARGSSCHLSSWPGSCTLAGTI